ncbi:TIGR03668 family PPOX class F420-dependent oxidoreductase [Streptomyces sp. NPDC018019]|uniref:TIGR03668 family PPOX class F420-dependent oxidoreductase n=1 Tax=Streptomyces sp. NPDC018019 TaxID=3365030 RepID=UPI0037945A8B
MKLSEAQCRDRFDGARVLRLATADADGRPHLVPATFVRRGEEIAIAVDSKPKSNRNLKRLRNIIENPAVSVLVDQYDDGWQHLWWVRADGDAAVVDITSEARLTDALVERYPQYREAFPKGPLIVISVHKWVGWSISG